MGKDLGCTFDEETWEGILSDNGKYIREARGQFIQYEILDRYYYTATRLNNMGLIKDSLCWKCKTEHGTYMHYYIILLLYYVNVLWFSPYRGMFWNIWVNG